jgi:hypothetical protein
MMYHHPQYKMFQSTPALEQKKVSLGRLFGGESLLSRGTYQSAPIKTCHFRLLGERMIDKSADICGKLYLLNGCLNRGQRPKYGYSGTSLRSAKRVFHRVTAS